MFESGSSAGGTTTQGADISTAIPMEEWAAILKTQLNRTTNFATTGNWPLFFIDSEGMGVRGGTYDYLTTAPPAIISKVIIYVQYKYATPSEILGNIDDYLSGLEKITMDEGNMTSSGGNGIYCSRPLYGDFVIIINRMEDDGATDDDLYRSIMTPEAPGTSGYEERNIVRYSAPRLSGHRFCSHFLAT